MDWELVIIVAIFTTVIFGVMLGIIFKKAWKVLVGCIFVFIIASFAGMLSAKVMVDINIVRKIVLETRESDDNMIYQISEHLKRENDYSFTNPNISKDLGKKSEISDEIIIDTYNISWDVEKTKKGKVGDYTLEIKVITDSNKYTDVPVKVEIRHGY